MATNQLITRRAFKPYGEVRGTKPTTWPNRHSYLGVGIDDAATGLTHIGAREYDQSTGHFISADPIIDIKDPLQMNGYAYANNGPVSNSDPTGLMNTADLIGKPCPECGRDHFTWQDEGSAQYDYSGNGYITVFPTVNVPANWDRAPEYINTFYAEMREDVCEVDLSVCTDLSLPVFSLDVNNSKGEACKSVGGKCPGGLEWGYPAQISGALGAAKYGPEGPAGGFTAFLPGKKQKSNPCDQCFLAGTKVLLADRSAKGIEDVEVGDKVLATDPKSGETGPRTVTQLIITEHDKHFNELSIATSDGIEKLTATFEHPFWSPSEGTWDVLCPGWGHAGTRSQQQLWRPSARQGQGCRRCG